jgi:hypothetical protein
MAGSDLIQVVVLPNIRPALERWLADWGLMLFRMPADAQRPDDLPTYGIGPTDETMRRWTQGTGTADGVNL